MITIETKLYTFEELTAEEQQKVIGKNFDINIDFEGWADCFLGDEYGIFKEKLKKMGFHNPTINYSGFGYQSDYLSITDCSLNVEKFLRYNEIWTKYKKLHSMINYQENANCGELGGAGAISFDVSNYVYSEACEKDQESLLETLVDDITNRIKELESEFFITLRDHYFDLISDELVKETLISNGYYFDKETLALH